MESSPPNLQLEHEARRPVRGGAPELDTRGLTRTAGRGMLWNVAGSAYQGALQMLSSIVLARVLFPEDFGIVGMAVLAQGLIGRIGILNTRYSCISAVGFRRFLFVTNFFITFPKRF